MGWHTLHPTQETQITQDLSARQFTLRARLSHHYWITECVPISKSVVERIRARMIRRDPKDAMEEHEVQEVLHTDFGFEAVGDCWAMPSLLHEYQVALGSVRAKQESSSLGGKRSGETRRAKAQAEVTTAEGMSSRIGTDPDSF